MAALAATDVTYTIEESRSVMPGRVRRRVKLAFGDGALTYPAAGIPLTLGNLGCTRVLQSMNVMGRTVAAANENAVYEWNGSQTAPKLLALEAQTAGQPLTDVDTSYAPAAQVVWVEVEGW